MKTLLAILLVSFVNIAIDSPHRSDYLTSYRHGAWKVIYHYIPSKTTDGTHY